MFDSASIPQTHASTNSQETGFAAIGMGELASLSGLLTKHQAALGTDRRQPGTDTFQPLALAQQYLEQETIVSGRSTLRSVTHSQLDKPSDLVRKSQRRDRLTGLSVGQSLVNSTANLQSTGFNMVSGYGLVNAAKAVAWSSGYYPYAFADVPDWGGIYTGNDIVKAQEAWTAGYTGQGVTVAVIDSGVDINHPDLNDNIWRNPGEIAGDNIDNDRNGYVDDLYGWNFGVGQNNNDVRPGTATSGQGHGTHVAGTIAAEANSFGTVGVAPNAKIMALRMGNVNSGNDFTNPGNLAQAIYYAVNNGARVINMSLGWTDSPQIRQAMAYAASRNVLTVSASGNQGLMSPGNPAKYATEFGIAVGAIRNNGSIPSFSNWAGSDRRMQYVVAPGVDVVSTLPNDRYGLLSGTSMAAPHVSGVAALMLSANPNLTHAQMRYILSQSATT